MRRGGSLPTQGQQRDVELVDPRLASHASALATVRAHPAKFTDGQITACRGRTARHACDRDARRRRASWTTDGRMRLLCWPAAPLGT